jgi:hypothetical protein
MLRVIRKSRVVINTPLKEQFDHCRQSAVLLSRPGAQFLEQLRRNHCPDALATPGALSLRFPSFPLDTIPFHI